MSKRKKRRDFQVDVSKTDDGKHLIQLSASGTSKTLRWLADSAEAAEKFRQDIIKLIASVRYDLPILSREDPAITQQITRLS